MTKNQSQHNPGDLVICTFGRTFSTLGSSRDLCIVLSSYEDGFYGATMVTLLHGRRVFSVHESYMKGICENPLEI